MTVKGYCTPEDVADLLQTSFSEAENGQCLAIIENLEQYIDAETGRGWLVGAQTNEAHFVQSQNVFLRYAPVSTITTVTGRAKLGDSETALVEDVDYEIIDLLAGRLRLVYPQSYDRVLVTYTPVDTVPGDLKQAAIEYAAAKLMPSLTPGTYGLDSIRFPDLQLNFSRSHVQETAPPFPQHVIDRYRWGVIG